MYKDDSEINDHDLKHIEKRYNTEYDPSTQSVCYNLKLGQINILELC